MLALWYNGISARANRARAAANVNRHFTQKAKSHHRLLLSATKYFAFISLNRLFTVSLCLPVEQ